MPTVASPPPVNPTGHVAQAMPGYDAAPVIVAQEQNLAEYLNMPVQEILSRLGLSAQPDPARPEETDEHNPNEAPPAPPAPPSGQPGGGMDPMGLIKPVTDALGTLGSGNFGNSDPTKMFDGIMKAFDTTANPLQGAVAGLEDGWRGAASSEAATKTSDAVTNGAEMSQQAAELRRSLASAAAHVQQSQARLIAIITEFQATIAAIGPNIVFPWGWAAAVAAATQAVTMSAETMTELQAALASESAAVTTAGVPLAVTAVPEGAAALGPLMQLASAGVSSGTSAISSGVQAGAQAEQQRKADAERNKPGTGAASASLKTGGGTGGGGAAGGGGGASAGPLTARTLAPMSAPTTETTSTATQSTTARPAVSAGMGATGAGGVMGAAPMHGGAGRADVSGHEAASFLHTSDQGGEIVGDLGSVAPPVLGEVDPNDTPDIELRI